LPPSTPQLNVNPDVCVPDRNVIFGEERVSVIATGVA
jgi:hypothetical protein